jgi:alpha-glucosidase (family GH31 glycosyl hydrolase)
MPQKEYVPRGYQPCSPQAQDSAPSVYLRSNTHGRAFDFTFDAIRLRLFRVTFTSKDHPVPPHPNVPKPLVDLRSIRIATTNISPSRKDIEVGEVTASVDWSHTPVVSLSWSGSQQTLHQDVPLRSYVADSTGVAHYSVHDQNALHVGLGEKAAPMDLTGRHFIISATDCFGYNVYRTDPLYKHFPLLIKATMDGCVAILSTSHSRGTWSVGSEIDGLWGHFKVYRQDYGGLEEYLIVGRTLKEVVRTYAELAGFPLLVPRWAFGYISGGYKYPMSDDPPASQVLLDFVRKLKENDIPCSAHQMSSGYSIAETEPKVRNVFNWNKHRFPDPEKWIAELHSKGLRLLTNIKPFVLTSHPDYQNLADSGALFRDPETKGPAIMRLWSAGGGEGGDGCHVDFTSATAFKWWYNGVQRLKRAGVDAMWNDNNEYTLPSDDWEMALEANVTPRVEYCDTTSSVGLWGRAMHTELMAKASHDALRDADPEKRPFVLTRSATPGTLRYAASSWSGDDVTSWEGMKGANALSLTAGICLLQVRLRWYIVIKRARLTKRPVFRSRYRRLRR